MSYCDFCQAVHSSASCFHPGQAKIAALERELAEARAEVERLRDDKVAIAKRHLEAEAKQGLEGEHGEG